MKAIKSFMSYKKHCMLFLSMTLAVCTLVTGSVSSESGVRLKDKFLSESEQSNVEYEYKSMKSTYSYVSKEYNRKGYKAAGNIELVLDAGFVAASDKGDIPVKEGVGEKTEKALLWTDDYKWFEWKVYVPEEGLYEIAMEYYPIDGSRSVAHRSMTIDGNSNFDEMQDIAFAFMWKDSGRVTVNNIGDEVRPRQQEVMEWRSTKITDSEGKYEQPLQFYFSAGSHVIRMTYVSQPIAFGNMIIRSPKTLKTYKEIKNIYDNNNYTYGSETIKFQAEQAVVEKNNQTIRVETDSDPLTEPASDDTKKLNAMGGWSWRKGNEKITWKFDVPEDGLYKIGMRALQKWSRGLPVYRQIELDGSVPFKEMSLYMFQGSTAWQMEVLHDKDNEPYLFYLKKGEHTLTMTVKMGPLAQITDSMKEDLIILSDITQQIIMLTGNNPDYNYEYELQKNIPDLVDNLKILSESMQTKIDIFNSISTKRLVLVNDLLMMKDQLDGMIADPDSVSRKLNDLNNTQTSLGSWMLALQDQPLFVDYFKVGNYKENWGNAQSNVFQKINKTWVNFIRSFTKDYDSVGGNKSKDNETTINVWVTMGKEWAEVMKNIADEDFTPNTGINVNMNVLPASQLNAGVVNALMLAVSSGKTPDVACGMTAGSPVEFAIRDSVADLSSFSDFNEVSKQFYAGTMVPYKYMNKYYALPETINFNVLFYRKDILSKLGIKIPDTWEEVYENVLPVLYRNGMGFYCPQDTAQTAPQSLPIFLYQNKGTYYSDDGKRTGLDTPEAYKGFKEWTDLYTTYAVPTVANFFNRMRTGEMPIGIGSYTLYMQLSVAAPELIGRWGIAAIPGHKSSDGTIDRTVGGIEGTSVVIMNQSRHKKEAWEFLKWWTGTEVQTRFGNELEALIGTEARWNTANREAFEGLPWDNKDMKVIMKQLETSVAQPITLGGYFTNRHVINAWNSVVLGGENARDSLEKAVKEINKELRAKQEEYGIAD